jgi:transcription elongation GreA/GreB family factor
MDHASDRQRPCYTRAGYERLLSRIARAREDYLAVCRTNEEAAGAGDSSVWHDNFAYEENQRRMHQLATRVADLERLAQSARIVSLPSSIDRVMVGTRVTVRIEDRAEARWEIAGFDDGDPVLGRISYVSPLGRALIGTIAGEVLEVVLDGRARELEVIAVTRAELEEVA